MQRRIQRVFTSIKEHTSVSYAKIATLGGLCDVDLTIVKATPPDDFPLHDKYVQEFAKIFSISSSSYRAFTISFSRRFSKTKSWRVALKCLLLLHRLLRTLHDDKALRAELLWARMNGLISLNPCNFRDCSSSSSEDYTSFIRSYAVLLDETLECDVALTSQKGPMITKGADLARFIAGELEKDLYEVELLEEHPLHKLKDLEKTIAILPQLQSLIDRVIDCWPIGVAAKSFLVHSAMKHVIRESFECYEGFKRDIVIVLDNLIQLPYSSSLAAFSIYKKASLQADQLSQFHEWSKRMGYCGSYEYPLIERIPSIQVRAVEAFLNGMWNLSDQSSSSPYVSTTQTTMSSAQLSSTSSTMNNDDDDDDDDDDDGDGDDDGDDDEFRLIREIKGYGELEKDVELEPLIKHEHDDSSLGWEELLEASIEYASRSNDWAFKDHSLQMQACNNNPYGIQATPQPYYQQQHAANLYYGSCPNTPLHTWGL